MNCEHRRRKSIATHGKKSKGYIICKDCDEILSRNKLAKEYAQRKRQYG